VQWQSHSDVGAPYQLKVMSSLMGNVLALSAPINLLQINETIATIDYNIEMYTVHIGASNLGTIQARMSPAAFEDCVTCQNVRERN